MKNSAIKVMFSNQYNVSIDDVTVEFRSVVGDEYEYRVSVHDVKKDEWQTYEFVCYTTKTDMSS